MKIITTHKNADFDALASVMAVKILFPDAIPVLPKQVNPNVKAFLSIHKDVFNTYTWQEVDLDSVDHLFVVDTNKWERLEGMAVLKTRPDLDIHLWDHHPIQGNISASCMVSEVAGANITLLIRRIKEEQHKLSPIQSTLFLLGLYEDTGNLTFPSTTAEDAYAAAYLLERKADLTVTASFLRPAYGEKQKEILFSMLQNAERLQIKGHTISISHIEIGGHVDSLAVVMRMYREILNVKAAVGVFSDNQKNTCMVIGRSHADDIDIGMVMQGLGGGGHPGAGSAMLKNSHPEAVREKILTLIQGNQPASVQISDIMSFPVVTALSGDTMEDVAFLLRKKGCTGVPVLENGELVGIVSRRDFRKLKKTTQMKSPVKAYMSRKIITIAPGKSPTQAAQLMVKYDVGRLPVVENDQVIGIVTRSDTMMYFYDQLPD